MPPKQILCLDFDGVLHSYTSGWKGADVIPDPPVAGAMEFLFNASFHFSIHIFSSRSHQKGGIDAMREWVKHWVETELDEFHHPGHLYLVERDIEFPTAKPPAHVSIDDRALTFDGTWPEMQAILAERGELPVNESVDPHPRPLPGGERGKGFVLGACS